MHCDLITIFLSATAAALPTYVAARFRSALRLRVVAQPDGPPAAGLAFVALKLMPWLAERSVERVLAVRDEKLAEVLGREVPRGSRILDVGCGEGRLALAKEQGYDVHGIGLDAKAVETTRLAIGAELARQGDLLNAWPLEDEVDVVLLCDSFRTTTQPHRLLRRALRIAPVVVVTESHQLWHTLGRVLFLRFFFRVGHLSRLDPNAYPVTREYRTFWHRVWVFRAVELAPPTPLVEAETRESIWFERSLIYPSIAERIGRALLVNTAAVRASAGAIFAYGAPVLRKATTNA